MKMLALIPCCLSLLIIGCSSRSLEHATVPDVNYGAILTGIKINGILAGFEILEYSAATGDIRGNVLLQNTSEEMNSIRMFDLFYLHLAVEGNDGKPVPTLDSVGAINPTSSEYRLKSPFPTPINNTSWTCSK